jgi:hypothetical protein
MTKLRSDKRYAGGDPNAYLHRAWMRRGVPSSAFVDGLVLLGGCNKTIPALLMAAASVDLPAVVISGGPMLVGSGPRRPGGLARAPGDPARRRRRGAGTACGGKTNPGRERLQGELKRTTFQLRLFADVLRDGPFLQATMDRAEPDWPMGADGQLTATIHGSGRSR